MTSRARLILVGVALVSLLLTDTASVLARAGSGGSRGSRSYSTPARPSSPASPTTPSSPSPALTQPSPSLQRPSFFGGLLGGIAGGAGGPSAGRFGVWTRWVSRVGQGGFSPTSGGASGGGKWGG